MEKIKRIQKLVDICNYHSNLYYNLDKPEISDKEYDKFYQELEVLEKETNYILSSSPTQKVQGIVVDYLQKVTHTEPMLSAEKSKDINDVIKFMRNQDCVLSWKLDGLTLVLKYNEGKFQQAITRGSGFEGEDVTHNVKVFMNVPMTIDYKGYLEIRGEGLVLLNEFEKVNAELISQGEIPYSNCRNLASGSVRQLNSKITKERNLIFIAFGIIKCEENFNLKEEQLRWLQKQGFEVVYNEVINKDTLKMAVSIFKDMIPNLSFLTDGLIIEYNNIAYGKAQGSTGHHSKSLYALKWNDDNYETIFRDVELNTTRTGMVSLTGIFDEVDIDGVKVTRASLHNYDIFESLQLGYGDTISVYRANQVIPQIEDNLTRSDTYKIEMKCPSCGSNIVLKQPKEARFLFCENINCPAQLLRKIEHAVSKDALNIDGLSEATLEKFIDKGFIKNISDVYKLELYKDKIVKMEGMGIRSYTKMIEAIEKSKDVKFENFVYSLGINQIGKGGAKRLAKYFNNDIEAFLEATKSHYTFMNIEDFGSITAYAVYDYFDNEDNMNQVRELLSIVRIKQEEKKDVDFKSLEGLAFVVTGSVETFKNRKELEDLITSLNGKLNGSVSAKTNFLINNDTTSTTGKNQKAKDLGVKIISENEFNIMIGRS